MKTQNFVKRAGIFMVSAFFVLTSMGKKERQVRYVLPPSGATDGIRTRDLRLGKPPLCQLSYYRLLLPSI